MIKIITYATTDPDVPLGFKAVAHLFDGKTRILPMRFCGPTEDDARSSAQAWIDDETAREAKAARVAGAATATQLAALEKARAARAAKKQTSGDIL